MNNLRFYFARKVLCAIGLTMLTCHVAIGQAQKFSARLVDEASGAPVMYANVALMREADSSFVRGTTTAEDGSFAIDGDSVATLVRFSAVGYESLWLRAASLPAVVHLKSSATMLAEVSVVAERPLYAVDGEKNMYYVKEDVSVQRGTASDALQNAPGVEVDAEGNITLRGSGAVDIWINDRPSHMNAEALKQYIKQLPAGAIERVEVIANPSARYSSSGGVINIVTNQKVVRNELFCIGLNARTSPAVTPWISYVWANDKVDFNVYLNFDYARHEMASDGTSTLLTAAGDTSRYQSYKTNSTSRNKGGYAGLNFNWNIDNQTNLATWAGVYPYWGHYENEADYEYVEYLPVKTDLGYHHTHLSPSGFGVGGYVGAWFEHRFDTTGRKLSLSLNGNTWNNSGRSEQRWVYNNTAIGTNTRLNDIRSTSPSIGAELNYLHPLLGGWEVEAGLSSSIGGGTQWRQTDSLSGNSVVNMPLRSYNGTERGTAAASYLTVQKRWGSFTAKVGLRGEAEWKQSTWSHFGNEAPQRVDTFFFTPVPSLHLSYTTASFSNYSLSFTRRFATPGSSQLNTFRTYDDYSFSTGNPNLLRAYTYNVEAAWSRFVMGFGNLGFNAYYSANSNEIGNATGVTIDPAIGPYAVNYTYPDNIGSSHTEGADVNITYRPTAMLNLRFNASVFNYGYTYNDVTDSKVSYSLSLNLWTKLWNSLELFANGRYTSPRLGLYSLSVENYSLSVGVSSDLFDRKLSLFISVNDLLGWSQWGSNTQSPNYNTTGSERYNSQFVIFGLTVRLGKMELEGKARQGATTNAPTMM